MSGRDWEREYDSHVDFYRDVYGQHVTGVYQVGHLGATVIEALQSAGDWSDAPSPDLIFGWVTGSSVGISMDLGAGRFAGVYRSTGAILVGPQAGASIQVHGAHRLRALAVPYQRLSGVVGVYDERLPADGDFGRLHAGILHDPALVRLLGQVWDEASGGAPNGALFSDGLLLQLVAVLLRMGADAAVLTRNPASGGLAPWQVKRVTEFMEDRLADDVSLEDLSKLLDLSTFHLCRAFKQSTGLPPHRWRHQRRIERARDLLEGTDLPVTEVAAQVGYDDPSQLAAAFRKALGLSPSQYRRERRS